MGIYKKGKSWYINFYYQGQRYQECIGPVSKTVAKEILVKRKAEVIEGRYDINQAKVTPLFEAFLDQYLETFSSMT
ncbi:MAG: hypothetical protein HYY20_10275 [Candidatus Tectomicrobia bacterium]|uniref:Site-specific integrase n=1 Tax=Tectimicrobiota bacterium TaxID=2528274 RepID=A0A932CPQ9_UNCTE|nr:hypothetical protein [Candidatus Tectomicrobia bacterium]